MPKIAQKNQITDNPTRTGAKLKPAAPTKMPSKAEFDLLVEEYLRRYKESTDMWNYATENLLPRIQAYVVKHGEHDAEKTDRPDDSVLYHKGLKWHNRGIRRRTGKDQPGIDYCKENNLAGTKCVTVLDQPKWEALCEKGKIPEDILEQVNAFAVTYKLYHTVSDKPICPECETILSKKDKFCKNCGHKMEDTK